jgi:hypothetical protein
LQAQFIGGADVQNLSEYPIDAGFEEPATGRKPPAKKQNCDQQQAPSQRLKQEVLLAHLLLRAAFAFCL